MVVSSARPWGPGVTLPRHCPFPFGARSLGPCGPGPELSLSHVTGGLATCPHRKPALLDWVPVADALGWPGGISPETWDRPRWPGRLGMASQMVNLGVGGPQNTDGLQLTVVRPVTFQLYDGARVTHVQ